MQDTLPKLALRKIACSFGSFAAVKDVTIELQAGEFVSLLGPSGCGKTTTLRMIAGFIKPTFGTIEMDGEVLSSSDATRPPERRNMSMIFQSYAVWPHMTVAENVGFGLSLRRRATGEVREKVERILDVVRLSALAQRYPAELSGGQQQRVALARAIVVEPRVLLLDEPLSNLDASLREEMRFEIRRLHDEFRITTVYVTHDQSEAMVTSDRIAVMNLGKVEQIGEPYEVYNQPRTRFVAGFIGRTNFIEATVANGMLTFDGRTFPVINPRTAAPFNGPITLSIRPQNIALTRNQAPVTSASHWTFQGTIQQRSYLGECWDYIVVPSGGDRSLRVSTPPTGVFEVGDAVWLVIDPSLVVSLPS
jgi:ABC-type Fe3+/spermidine/putrescine transport system ATPase subunit